MRVLVGDGDGAPHVSLAELAQVAAAEHHAPLLGVEEAEHEVDDRRLAGSALPDERDPPPRLEAKAEAVEHGIFLGRITGADVFECEHQG